ncbi:putative LOC107387426-like protein [Nothobranchius furzeri]|uniref:Gypsy retrotransposon integrase-like protein 1 n=1 Tax=Nothobranchius furzeri TaxID=105023 RepID=A0A9D2XK56_NOTFU|nr:putative LOC107387426-like protein [Nothobranchius furzeri]
MLDLTVVQQLDIPTVLLATPPHVSSLDGNSLTTITHQTVPINLLTPRPKTSEPPDLSRVPPEYRNLQQVFSKDRASSLPPHRPSIPEHRHHVRAVLQRLLENHLYVKAEKCEFHSTSVKFLGFIRNYSTIATPLTQLTSIKKFFSWTSEADLAFKALKDSFTQAPILTRPDPGYQFTMEVDADTGVGAVLSQFSPSDKMLNTKPDALSRQYPSDKEVESTTILPSSCIVGAITCDITAKVLETQQTEPDPGTGLPNRTCVPSFVRSSLIKWTHASKFSIHPGVGRTLALIRRTFWWPALYKDVKEYISACQVCARGKANIQPPHGLLCPLLVPSRPWSHIALDFVTGLPFSKGFNSILTLVNRFSKSCHLVPLQHLPTSAETANLLIKHVFRLHGIPSEILLDRGPQFKSRVWKEFANHLGARVALSSGFHPQTNGQRERMNQELEAMLRCVLSSIPSEWSNQLAWIKYAHNAHVCSATGQSPFEISLRYRPPLFPSDHDPPATAPQFIRRTRRTWNQTRAALQRITDRNRRLADRRIVDADASSMDLGLMDRCRRIVNGSWAHESTTSPSSGISRPPPRLGRQCVVISSVAQLPWPPALHCPPVLDHPQPPATHPHRTFPCTDLTCLPLHSILQLSTNPSSPCSVWISALTLP